MRNILETGTSLKFKHISENKMKIISELLKNQELLRRVSFLDGDYDSNKIVTPQDVLRDNIVLTKFSEEVLTERRVTIFFSSLRGNFRRKSVVSEDTYAMDIIIPNKHWYCYEEMVERAFVIAEEVSKSIDQKRIAGIGEVFISEWKTYKLNDRHAGLTLFINVSNATIKR